ncbi:MAG TPA: sugar phosphate nucleotidyltransferase [Candidatus Peribacterales bacterium]|nr:sugar phosphate nucleotidyltransferase [Candidatus Peribacterales bacterium]
MKLTQAILPLAGLGTRFLPWTKVMPKEMLPIGNKPIVALLVDECISAGITDICFVISKGKEAIAEYFYEDSALEEELARRGKIHLLEELTRYNSINFHVVYQEEQLGDGHAILQARDWVESDHVAVLFGDDLIVHQTPGLVQLKDHSAIGAILCLEDIPHEKVSSYGIADVEPSDNRLKIIRGLVEKPLPENAPSTFGIVGRYILPRNIFDSLAAIGTSHGGEVRIIDGLVASLGKTPVCGYLFEGKRYDTGTPAGYREAVMALG